MARLGRMVGTQGPSKSNQSDLQVIGVIGTTCSGVAVAASPVLSQPPPIWRDNAGWGGRSKTPRSEFLSSLRRRLANTASRRF